MEAFAVTVEVHVAGGLPSFTVAGLPATVVRESRERVRAALTNLNFTYPVSRIVAHLGPADRPKTGGCFDLPVALGLLLASGQLQADVGPYEFLGELALNGDLRAVPGVLPAVAAAQAAGRELIVPHANAAEAGLVEGAPVHCAKHLGEVVQFLRGERKLSQPAAPGPQSHAANGVDLSEIHGQEQAKRALAIAAAGGHHMLMVGPPGSGKSMLAQRLPTLMPPMDYPDALEVAAVRSVAGLEIAAAKFYQRPFRSPHHGASSAALVGGGARPRPGEISLAHRGILFLDELPEFPRPGLEALREPIETGQVCIARANGQATFPARFQLVAAMNPCPCGFHGDSSVHCSCSPARVDRYRQKVSGPLLDRIDLYVEVGRPPVNAFYGETYSGETSADVRSRVVAARRKQRDRGVACNAELAGERIKQYCALNEASRKLLDHAAEKFALSVRAYQRVLRIARTIADLDDATLISTMHVAEAIRLRGIPS
jgi:magnesium chelatase family protein